MNRTDKDIWLETRYPLTIVCDRYAGTYSKGNYLAFPLEFNEVPEEVNGEDGECGYFWNNYKEPVGKGATVQEAIDNLVEQMEESEDERIRKEIKQFIIDSIGEISVDDKESAWLAYLEKQKPSEEAIRYVKENHSPDEVSDFQAAMNIAVAKAYDKGVQDTLERQKDASEAMDAVERIDSYITEHTANSWEMDDSNPDKKYYCGVDDTLSNIAGILQGVYAKQKESLHIPETYKENVDSFTDALKDVIVAIEKYLDWLTGYPDYAPKGKYSLRDMLHCLSILEKQKEQKPIPLMNGDADLYFSNWYHQEIIGSPDRVPTAQQCFEEGLRYSDMVHLELKQKELKPAEWSEEDEEHRQNCLQVIKMKLDEKPYPYYQDYLWLKDRINSLRPQPHWKPSEEQLRSLQSAINNSAPQDYEHLTELYEQLKKLKEE